jgi:hypothetical protein
MRALVVVALALSLISCKSDAPPPAVQVEKSETSKSGWAFYFSEGVTKIREDNGEHYFVIPQSGHVNYVLRKSPSTSIVGKRMTIRFSIIGDGSVAPVSDELPATLSMIFQIKGDDWVNQDGRWWYITRADISKPGYYELSAEIRPELWSNVQGKHGDTRPDDFSDSANDVANIGFTFGGKSFAGHGVKANGAVRFQLHSFEIK